MPMLRNMNENYPIRILPWSKIVDDNEIKFHQNLSLDYNYKTNTVYVYVNNYCDQALNKYFSISTYINTVNTGYYKIYSSAFINSPTYPKSNPADEMYINFTAYYIFQKLNAIKYMDNTKTITPYGWNSSHHNCGGFTLSSSGSGLCIYGGYDTLWNFGCCWEFILNKAIYPSIDELKKKFKNLLFLNNITSPFNVKGGEFMLRKIQNQNVNYLNNIIIPKTHDFFKKIISSNINFYLETNAENPYIGANSDKTCVVYRDDIWNSNNIKISRTGRNSVAISLICSIHYKDLTGKCALNPWYKKYSDTTIVFNLDLYNNISMIQSELIKLGIKTFQIKEILNAFSSVVMDRITGGQDFPAIIMTESWGYKIANQTYNNAISVRNSELGSWYHNGYNVDNMPEFLENIGWFRLSFISEILGYDDMFTQESLDWFDSQITTEKKVNVLNLNINNTPYKYMKGGYKYVKVA